MSLANFLNSPQNRTGIAIWAATALTALVQQFVVHQPLSSADLFGLVLGLLKIVEPENTATLAQLEGAVADVKALIGSHSADALVKVSTDVSGLIKPVEG